AELVIVVLAVDRVAQPEAGIMEIDIACRPLHQWTESEEIGDVVELRLLAVGDDEDVDGGGVVEAGMKEIEGEAVRLALPDRLVRIEADIAILVVGEIVEAGRHRDLLFDERLLGTRPRELKHIVVAESFGFSEKLNGLSGCFQKTCLGSDPQYCQPLQRVKHATPCNTHSTQLLARLTRCRIMVFCRSLEPGSTQSAPQHEAPGRIC